MDVVCCLRSTNNCANWRASATHLGQLWDDWVTSLTSVRALYSRRQGCKYSLINNSRFFHGKNKRIKNNHARLKFQIYQKIWLTKCALDPYFSPSCQRTLCISQSSCFEQQTMDLSARANFRNVIMLTHVRQILVEILNPITMRFISFFGPFYGYQFSPSALCNVFLQRSDNHRNQLPSLLRSIY